MQVRENHLGCYKVTIFACKPFNRSFLPRSLMLCEGRLGGRDAGGEALSVGEKREHQVWKDEKNEGEKLSMLRREGRRKRRKGDCGNKDKIRR